MRIPSTIDIETTTLDDYYPSPTGYQIKPRKDVIKLLEGKKVINIAIAGCGPIGLFLASYLNFYFNSGSLDSGVVVRVILFDNRVEEYKGKLYRKPFTRRRPFATDSAYFSVLFNKIFCIQEDQNYLFLNINLMEYMLFSKLFVEKVPFYFWSPDTRRNNELLKKLEIDVLFDCTGGRLMRNYCSLTSACNPKVEKWLTRQSLENIPDYLKKTISKEYEIKTNDIDDLIHVIPQENLVIFNKSGSFLKNYYYSSISIFSLKKLKWKEKIDIDIESQNDLDTFLMLNNKFFRLEDLLTICKVVKDNEERNKIYSFYKKFIKKSDINKKEYIIQFTTWNTYMRHSLEISREMNAEGKKILYVGAGDTIFHSHFMVGAGLNRTIDFAVRCSNLLINLKD